MTNQLSCEYIKGHKVEFDSVKHMYYVDGNVVPSISQICKLDNPSMYNGVSQFTLNNAAIKGSKIHQEIEDFELHGITGSSVEFSNYHRIKKQLGFSKEMTERIVIIKIDNKVVCAGRFDLLASMNGEKLLIDFKRTSQIHIKYVTLQLNLYRLGLLQSYDIEVTKLMLIRLRDYEINVIDILIQELETIKKLTKLVF